MAFARFTCRAGHKLCRFNKKRHRIAPPKPAPGSPTTVCALVSAAWKMEAAVADLERSGGLGWFLTFGELWFHVKLKPKPGWVVKEPSDWRGSDQSVLRALVFMDRGSRILLLPKSVGSLFCDYQCLMPGLDKQAWNASKIMTHTHTHTHKQTSKQASKQTNKQTNKQASKQASKQANAQTNKQSNKQ